MSIINIPCTLYVLDQTRAAPARSAPQSPAKLHTLRGGADQAGAQRASDPVRISLKLSRRRARRESCFLFLSQTLESLES